MGSRFRRSVIEITFRVHSEGTRVEITEVMLRVLMTRHLTSFATDLRINTDLWEAFCGFSAGFSKEL